MKVLFIINSLGMGGAERVFVEILNHLSLRPELSICAVTLKPSRYDFYNLSDCIRRHSVFDDRNYNTVISKIKRHVVSLLKLRSIINNESPDLIIPFMDFPSFYTLISNSLRLSKRASVYISLRNDPRGQIVHWSWHLLRMLLYRYSKGFIVQTVSLKNYITKKYQKPVWVIPNPLSQQIIHKGNDIILPRLSKQKQFLIVARLVPQKSIDTAINAFLKSCSKKNGWSLLIVGDGSERVRLEELIKSQGLVSSVFIVGAVKDIASYYLNSSVFILPSLHEGFPNALIEAMWFNIPVIASNCLSGPAEIIRNGINGFLFEVGNYNELASIMDKLVKDEELRKKIGNNAGLYSRSYLPDIIVEKWFNLIYENEKDESNSICRSELL